MKNLIFYFLLMPSIIFCQVGTLQGTIKKDGPLLVGAYIKIGTGAVNGSVPNMNVTFSIDAAGLPVAPTTIADSPLAGVSISSVTVENIGGRYVYAFILTGNSPISWAAGIEYNILNVTFQSTAGGRFVRLHDFTGDGGGNSSQAFFDIGVNGIFYTNYSNMFYDGGIVSNMDGGNSFVEAASPLPITLKSFDAIKHSASSAKLDWTTSKEVNSDYFGIERSIDGSTWDEIARVKAAGDSNLDIAYDYIDDRLPLSRTNGQVFYYRLRMTDLDGAFKYSDVRGVNFDKQALGPISIYPNPTTEIVNIDLSEVVMEDGDVYVSVYDMSGRLVMTKQIIGSGIELIKVDQLPSDAYNFIIRQGEQIHQQRVIKID